MGRPRPRARLPRRLTQITSYQAPRDWLGAAGPALLYGLCPGAGHHRAAAHRHQRGHRGHQRRELTLARSDGRVPLRPRHLNPPWPPDPGRVHPVGAQALVGPPVADQGLHRLAPVPAGIRAAGPPLRPAYDRPFRHGRERLLRGTLLQVSVTGGDRRPRYVRRLARGQRMGKPAVQPLRASDRQDRSRRGIGDASGATLGGSAVTARGSGDVHRDGALVQDGGGFQARQPVGSGDALPVGGGGVPV